jgi:hypothetical protein
MIAPGLVLTGLSLAGSADRDVPYAGTLLLNCLCPLAC